MARVVPRAAVSPGREQPARDRRVVACLRVHLSAGTMKKGTMAQMTDAAENAITGW
jgi:hypothetical protein